MSQHVKQDEFLEIVKECGANPKEILSVYPDKFTTIPTIRRRIARYRLQGLLPLDSGNKISTGEILRGTSTLYDSNGSIKQQWVKSDVLKEDQLEAFKAAVDRIIDGVEFSHEAIKAPEYTDKDLMTIYPIGDAHIGMLAHAAETGADHDLNISKERHIAAIKLAVQNAPKSDQAFIIDVGELIANVT